MPLPRPTAIGRPVILGGGSGAGAGPFLIERRLFTSLTGQSITDIPPPGTKKAIYRGIGGGGGGSGGSYSPYAGGGGGAFARTTLKVLPTDIVVISPGLGGTGSTGNWDGSQTAAGGNGTGTTVTVNGVTVLYADFGRGANQRAGNTGGLGGSASVSVGDYVASGGTGGVGGNGVAAAGLSGTNGGDGGLANDGSTQGGGGGGSGGENVLGNLFNMGLHGSGGRGGSTNGNPFYGLPGIKYGGGGGGGASGGSNGGQQGAGGSGSLGVVMAEYYSDTYNPVKTVLSSDISKVGLAISNTPLLSYASAYYKDNTAKELGILGLLNTAGLTVNFSFSEISPDTNWLVLMGYSNITTPQSPVIQIYKRVEGTYNYSYYSSAPGADFTTGDTASGSGSSITPNDFIIFSSDSTEFSIPYYTGRRRLFWTLINGTWTSASPKTGFTGSSTPNALNTTNHSTHGYRESDDRLVKVEVHYLASNNNWYINGYNRNSSFYTSMGLTNSSTASGQLALGLSPLGTHFVAPYYNQSGGGAGSSGIRVFRFNPDGSFIGPSSATGQNTGVVFYTRSNIVWLTENRFAVLTGNGGFQGLALQVFDIVSDNSSLTCTLAKLTSDPFRLNNSQSIFYRAKRLDNNNILFLDNSLTFYILTIATDGTATMTASKKDAVLPAQGTNYLTHLLG